MYSYFFVLDGVEIRDIDPEFLHEKIGLVSQEPTLFGCTIAENIPAISYPLSLTSFIVDIYRLWNET